MKINIIILIIFTLIIAFYACTNSESENNALKKAEEYNKTISNNLYAYQNNLTDWLTPEKEYIYSENGDSSKNIIGLSDNYFMNRDRLYFQVSRNLSYNMWAYMSIKTGEKYYMCPDPLCPHTRESGCKYLDIISLVFSPDSSNIIYAVKTILSENGIYDVIYFIDTENNIMRELYKSDSISRETYNSFYLQYINNDKLYFLVTQRTNKKGDNGELEKTINYYTMSFDLTTNKVEQLHNAYANLEYGSFMFVNKNNIFFIDDSNNRLYTTDLNYENEKIIFNYDNDYIVRNFYYDENTQELYFILCSKYMFTISDNEITEGYVYCIDKDLKCRKIDMPSDKIINIQLTNNYIYYFIYDPIDYGNSPRGGSSIDKTGNKLYRVNRNDTSISELVFDGHSKMFFDLGYFVIGDYIYLDCFTLVNEGDLTWFRRTGSTARVNFKEGTIKWLNLD